MQIFSADVIQKVAGSEDSAVRCPDTVKTLFFEKRWDICEIFLKIFVTSLTMYRTDVILKDECVFMLK